MTDRRSHWDIDLIEAVNDAMENNAYHDEMVYAVIAAVEDWVYDNFQGGEYDNPVEYTPEELAIQRVREVCMSSHVDDKGKKVVFLDRIQRALDGSDE